LKQAIYIRPERKIFIMKKSQWMLARCESVRIYGQRTFGFSKGGSSLQNQMKLPTQPVAEQLKTLDCPAGIPYRFDAVS
jgi:hypothetical protein